MSTGATEKSLKRTQCTSLLVGSLKAYYVHWSIQTYVAIYFYILDLFFAIRSVYVRVITGKSV